MKIKRKNSMKSEISIFLAILIPTLCFCENGEKTVQSALTYLSDQNLEKAFETYLSALSLEDPHESPSKEDRELYEQILKIYQEHKGPNSAEENGVKILESYQEILSRHSDYYLSNFLLASAYANTGMYREFMETFYKSYTHFPHHYLAYKSKAALHIKLYERSPTPDEKEKQRQLIVKNVLLALEKNPEDPGLYKMMILFAVDREKRETILLYLNKMLESPIIVPRADVAFFVQQAAEVKLWDLAQRVIDKARVSYQYSRVVLAAQEFLDKQKIREIHE